MAKMRVPDHSASQTILKFAGSTSKCSSVTNQHGIDIGSCQPGCRIFASDVKGSFAKFIEQTKSGTGTVILHEEVTARLRRVPLIWQMIEKGRNYTFWSLTTGRRTPPRYPSRLDFDLRPDQYYLTRLFPSGRAFLVTPSFVISDPIKFCDLLHWSRRCGHRWLIVTSAEFPSWLQGLCQEKSNEWRYEKNRNGESGFKEFAHKYGLTMERIDAFWKAWELLRKIIEEHGDEETHANVRKVMWAPREINPNDEQSLVNWFFWWSTTSLDCYRRFYVLGSSVKNKATAYRTIRVPNYDPDQSLDPDELTEKHRLEREAEEQKILALWDPQGVGNPPATTIAEGSDAITRDQDTKSLEKAPTDRHRGSFVSQSGLPFPSSLFPSDRPDILKSWLIDRQHNCKTYFSTPFWQAISWQDVAMADHFGDPKCEYANFTHWLSTCQRFRKAKNTWFGLFYTPNGKWDPARPSHTYGRHPWIAVYRPVNPHLGVLDSYSATELFIWDLDVRKKTDLSDMQLRLIDFVRKETSKLVCADYFLDRVWYSNRASRAISPQSHILDATCLQLEDMMDDSRYWVPPFDGAIRTRGWHEIAPSEVTQKVEQLNMAINQRGHQQPFPKHYSDAEEPPSFVWLPPRGTAKLFRCYNDLYEAAYQNRAEDEACREFRYRYRPTLEWYEEQKREGRHFSYVCVDAGDRILDRLYKLESSKPK